MRGESEEKTMADLTRYGKMLGGLAGFALAMNVLDRGMNYKYKKKARRRW